MSQGTDKFDFSKQHWLRLLWKDILRINIDLYRVMIPIIILVKIAQEAGVIDHIARLLAPVMGLVDLPPSMGLVWATTMVSNIYGGMIVFASLAADEPLTVAQVTTLGGMMLIAHSLPVEVSISHKTGMRATFNLLLRVGCALLYGMLLNLIYTKAGWLGETNELGWIPEIPDNSLWAWVLSQLSIFVKISIIIALLVSFLRFLKYSGVENILIYLLKPILAVTGLGHKTVPITIVGMGMGLTYGGGLLIQESRKGDLSSKEIFGSMFLLALCHGLIEDTLLIMLLGADISGALYFRVIFSLILVSVVVRMINTMDAVLFHRFFMLKRGTYSASDKCCNK